MRFLAALFIPLFSLAAQAQAPQPVASPEVHSDGRVTFRLRAPNAKEVLLAREGAQRVPMQKDEQGVWSFTTEPLEPDLYAYSFVADGLVLVDPVNPVMKPNLLNVQSLLHVPGPSTLPWEVNDVPRGALHRHFYRSGVVGDDRDFYVYTPPGYDPGARGGYPVLYLLHGFSDDASGWTAVGRAHVVLDNLIAVRKSEADAGRHAARVRRAGGARHARPARRVAVAAQHGRVPRRHAQGGAPPGGAPLQRLEGQESARDRGPVDGRRRVAVHGPQRARPFRLGRGIQLGRPGRRLRPDVPRARARRPTTACACSGWRAARTTASSPTTASSSTGSKRKACVSPGRKLPGAHTWRVWRRYLAEFVPLLFREAQPGR